jgi:hypothetical protein
MELTIRTMGASLSVLALDFSSDPSKLVFVSSLILVCSWDSDIRPLSINRDPNFFLTSIPKTTLN